MARPPDPEKHHALARAAVDVLQREGLSIPASRLAEALGIKRPTLLYHFPTYGHLVETALTDILQEQAAFVMEQVNKHHHPVDRLYAQMLAVHAFHAGREARMVFLTQAIAATAGTRVTEILENANAVFEVFRAAQVAAIEEGVAQGLVKATHASALVAVVRALVDGLMVQRVLTNVELAPVHALVWEHLLAPLKSGDSAATPAQPQASTTAARKRAQLRKTTTSRRVRAARRHQGRKP
jgi:AcrR family transcriptional regulator